MSVLTIKAKELTKEGFAPYGSAVCIPTDGNPDRPTDRFNFWPKLCLYRCDSGVFQIGVSTFFKRPFRTVNMERHFKTEEFMTPLTGPIVIVFCPNKIVDGADTPDYEKMEAFLITENRPWLWKKGSGTGLPCLWNRKYPLSVVLPRIRSGMIWMFRPFLRERLSKSSFREEGITWKRTIIL